MAGLRKVMLKILIPALILIIIVMWACLPFYWGSRESYVCNITSTFLSTSAQMSDVKVNGKEETGKVKTLVS